MTVIKIDFVDFSVEFSHQKAKNNQFDGRDRDRLWNIANHLHLFSPPELLDAKGAAFVSPKAFAPRKCLYFDRKPLGRALHPRPDFPLNPPSSFSRLQHGQRSRQMNIAARVQSGSSLDLLPAVGSVFLL